MRTWFEDTMEPFKTVRAQYPYSFKSHQMFVLLRHSVHTLSQWGGLVSNPFLDNMSLWSRRSSLPGGSLPDCRRWRIGLWRGFSRQTFVIENSFRPSYKCYPRVREISRLHVASRDCRYLQNPLVILSCTGFDVTVAARRFFSRLPRWKMTHKSVLFPEIDHTNFH